MHTASSEDRTSLMNIVFIDYGDKWNFNELFFPVHPCPRNSDEFPSINFCKSAERKKLDLHVRTGIW